MIIIILLTGLLVSIGLSITVHKVSQRISKSESKAINIYITCTTMLVFLISYLRFDLSIISIKLIVLSCLLIIVSFIDLRHQIIPDTLSIIILITGLVFIFPGDVSAASSILGMFAGGVILFILALVPNVLGGGDIKLMFAVGAYLGLYKTVAAIFLGFALSSIISIFLLLFKLKGKKDYIPFAPFLALGSFISYLIFA